MNHPGITDITTSGHGSFVEAVRLPHTFPVKYRFRPWGLHLRAEAGRQLLRLSVDDFDTAEEAERVAFSYAQGPDEESVSARWDDEACFWDVIESRASQRQHHRGEDFHTDG